ncbi:MAG: N-acetylmuramoyl-L-alanine amidase [Actinomycetota bacterium]|nr:N-acetylmuramoyl-L-alanine amidase [Actinomycetota bacterium]
MGRLREGVVVPFTAVQEGWVRITTPCELARWMRSDRAVHLARPTIILDPGHGGNERGAVGPTGLEEKTINLDVAYAAADALASAGVPTALTRTGDYRATLAFRVAVANAAKPRAFVSIHHNSDPDGPLNRPGTETYFQIGSGESRRLAGLVYEDVVRGLSTLAASWVGDTDAGAKWRPNRRGGDYYGLLRMARATGITATLVELAFVSNPSEEALLRRADVRRLEGEAVARGILRYLRSNDPGGGFTTPYPRTEPAGPGGGLAGCVDPS